MGVRIAPTASDVAVMIATAILHPEFCARPTSALATELRVAKHFSA